VNPVPALKKTRQKVFMGGFVEAIVYKRTDSKNALVTGVYPAQRRPDGVFPCHQLC
jgi:hypothetical protein